MKIVLFVILLVATSGMTSSHTTATARQSDVVCPVTLTVSFSYSVTPISVPIGWSIAASNRRPRTLIGQFSNASFANNGTGGSSLGCDYLFMHPNPDGPGQLRYGGSKELSTQCHVGPGWQQLNGISWECSQTDSAACVVVCPS